MQIGMLKCKMKKKKWMDGIRKSVTITSQLTVTPQKKSIKN